MNFQILRNFFQIKMRKRKRPSFAQMVLTRGGPQSPRSKAGAKWLSKIRKGQVAPKGLHPQNNSHNLDNVFFLLSITSL